MAQLCAYADKLRQVNAEVLVISFAGTPASTRAWREETCPSFTVLLDQKRSVYQAYGVERSLVRSYSPSTIWLYVKLLLSGHSWHRPDGDSTQLGGDFIVDTHGIVRLSHPSHDAADRPPVSELVDLLSRPDWAFETVDRFRK